MLSHLQLRDFALVESLEVDLYPGLTVLTGETGAGKSILVEALALALGNRADSTMVRPGATRAEITVTMTLDEQPAARTWLAAQELEDEKECVLRRIIGSDGRSKAFINGRAVTRRQLMELGRLLVDIHGQHEHQSLLRRDFLLQLLDDYAAHTELLAAVASAYERLQALARERDELERLGPGGDALELLRYQLEELQAQALDRETLTALEEEYRRLSHAGDLLETAQRAVDRLEADEQGLQAGLVRIVHELQALLRHDSRLEAPVALLESAQIQLQEAADELRHYVQALDLDPARLQEVERRLSRLHDLARKHRVRLEALPELYQSLAQHYESLVSADQRRQALSAELATAEKAYLQAAEALRQSRRQAAGELAAQVVQHLQRLGMAGGTLEVQLTPLPAAQRSARGLDQVDFLVSANPGQPPRPLSKVASGGELSRISLAIHVVTAQRRGGIPTLIFDEVDVGVGGHIAEVVGRELKQLARHRQVLCITHLPQVAAQGQQHLRVRKRNAGRKTHIEIEPLEGEARQEEIARMLGGSRITARTRAHAQEMIESADS